MAGATMLLRHSKKRSPTTAVVGDRREKRVASGGNTRSRLEAPERARTRARRGVSRHCVDVELILHPMGADPVTFNVRLLRESHMRPSVSKRAHQRAYADSVLCGLLIEKPTRHVLPHVTDPVPGTCAGDEPLLPLSIERERIREDFNIHETPARQL